MSRSCKKHPVISIACHKSSGLQKWKREFNRSIRRIPKEEDMPSGRYIYKIIDVWTGPNDGKQWWDDPRARRK